MRRIFANIIKDIASNVKGWSGNWDAVYDNILLRGRIKQELVDLSEKLKKPDLIEAGFVSLSNNVGSVWIGSPCTLIPVERKALLSANKSVKTNDDNNSDSTSFSAIQFIIIGAEMISE